jgi:hypothetical protein
MMYINMEICTARNVEGIIGAEELYSKHRTGDGIKLSRAGTTEIKSIHMTTNFIDQAAAQVGPLVVHGEFRASTSSISAVAVYH